jgi:hypothetical protein
MVNSLNIIANIAMTTSWTENFRIVRSFASVGLVQRPPLSGEPTTALTMRRGSPGENCQRYCCSGVFVP